MIKKDILFLGLNDKDSKIQVINTLEAYKIVMNSVAGVGYEGATVSECTGFYTHQSGDFVIEKSLRIEILFSDDKKTLALVDILKKAFNQETIAVQHEEIKSELI